LRKSSCRYAAPGAIAGVLLLAGAPAQAQEGPKLYALAQPGPAPAGGDSRAAAYPAPDPSTLLLLLVDLDGVTLTEGLAAYGTTDDPLIPVGEFTRLLELDVDVLPAERRIIGRLGEARRSLVVDLASNTARVGPLEVKLAPDDVALTPNEIYIRASALQKLLPLKLDVNTSGLTLKLTAYELLPVQVRFQRQARQRFGSPTPNAATETMRVDDPYQLFSPPSFDVALGLGLQTQSPKSPARYDIRMGGDLLYAGLQAYVGSDEQGRASTTRVLLERRSLDGQLLGPLHARSVGLGDVYTPGLSIGPRSLEGRGFSLSTVALDQASVFNKIDLRGELPLGSDVELYVNDVLKGGQSAADKGQYEFLDVPLVQGINVVRIVTYGQRGQRSEETRIINVSGGLLKRGESTFEFGAAQQEEPLFRTRDFDPTLFDRSVGKTRVVANLNYGLTPFLTLATGAAVYHDRLGRQRSLYNAGLRTSLLGFATQVDVARDNIGGQAEAIGVAGRILGASVVLRHAEYGGGLIDENNPEASLDQPLRRRTEFDVDQNIRLGRRIVPISVQAIRDLYANGDEVLIGSARASTSIGSLLFSGGLEYERDRSASAALGGNDERLRGSFAASTFRNYKWQIRADVDYDIVPTTRPRVITITADRELSDRWSLRLGVSEHLAAPKGFELIAGSVTRTKFGDLSFTGDYDTGDDSWRLAVQLNFGLGYNPVSHSYQLTRSGPGSGGSVLFHAFSDTNGDGKFTPGEKPVANVLLEGGENIVRTGADGRAYISGFGANAASRLQVGLAEIDNPSVQAPPTSIQFSPRPGGVTEIEYPIRPTGEVMVNLKLRRADQKTVGLSAARLRLVDGRGRLFEGVTEFDGSVSFQDLPSGDYRLELDPEQAQRLRMRLVAPVTVTIKPDGSFTPDANAEVRFDPRDASNEGPSS
jgi:hypothetical protein